MNNDIAYLCPIDDRVRIFDVLGEPGLLIWIRNMRCPSDRRRMLCLLGRWYMERVLCLSDFSFLEISRLVAVPLSGFLFEDHVVTPPGEGPRAVLGLGRGGTCIAADLNPPNHAHRRRRGVLVGKVHWFPVALYEGDPVDGVDAITRRSLSLSFVRTPMVFPASLRAVKQFGHFTSHGAERPRKRL